MASSWLRPLTRTTGFWSGQRPQLREYFYEPDLSFAPNGPFYGKPGYWPKQKNNFAPRLSFAYSPDTKTSIRAGFGLYYDHYGEALVNTFSQQGSFGLSSALSRIRRVFIVTIRRRAIINRTTLPNISLPPAPTTTSFPYLYPQGQFRDSMGPGQQAEDALFRVDGFLCATPTACRIHG